MKQTEVGLIPDDWEVKRLGDLCSFSNGIAHESFVDENGEYILVNSKFISSEGEVVKYSKKQLFPVPPNSVLMVMSDVPNGKAIAKCFLVPKDFKGTLNQRICMFSDFKANNEYLYRIINRNKYYLSFDDGVKQTNLRKQDVLNCLIPLPPFEEQQRIAKALSDVDALITTTEKLIQKKKNIKQGIMQNLLTGKKRLPGFAKSTEYKQTELGLIPEDWEIIRLGEITDMITGYPFPGNKIKEYGKFRLLRGINITEGKIRHTEDIDRFYTGDTSSITKYFLREKDLVIGMDGSKVGRNSAIINKEDVNSLLVQRIARIREIEKLSKVEYIYAFVNSYFFSEYVDSLKTSSAIPHISPLNIQNFVFPIPLNLSEQTAIANVLSSMDKEIETLTTKLEKYRNLKTAMMQQLLTGKIRLR